MQALLAEDKLWWLADALAWVPAHQGRWPEALRLLAWADGLVQQRGEQRGPMFAAVRRQWDTLFGGHLHGPVDARQHDPTPAEQPLDETLALALAFCAPAPAAGAQLPNESTGALRYRARHG